MARSTVAVVLAALLLSACAPRGGLPPPGSRVERSQITQQPPAQTYFITEPQEIAALRAQVKHSPRPPTLDDLLAGDDRLLALVREERLSPTAAARAAAMLLTAQQDYLQLSAPSDRPENGDVDRLSTEVLCKLFREACMRLRAETGRGVSVDPVRSAVLAKVAERMTDDGRFPDKPGFPWFLSAQNALRPRKPAEPESPRAAVQREAVEAALAERTPEQEERIAAWDAADGSETIVGIWLRIADDGLREAQSPLLEAATIRAALAMAMADAAIAVEDAHGAFTVDSPSSGYPSGHAVISAAASSILSHFLPDRTIEWKGMAEEAGRSRLWAGVNTPADVDAGLTLGREVAMAVLRGLRRL